MTSGQQRALQTLWPKYGLDPDTPAHPAQLFDRYASVTLEIGFGNGEALVAMAQASPQEDFIGIEVHRPGVGHLLLALEQYTLNNVRVFNDDAMRVLQTALPDGCLDRVLLFFPDPWHKKRHHKRRLVQPGFVALLARKLRPGGILHMATDWEDYAGHMLAVVVQKPCRRRTVFGTARLPAANEIRETRAAPRSCRTGPGVRADVNPEM